MGRADRGNLKKGWPSCASVPPRRWVLVAVSLASLVVLAYAGVIVAFSVPVGEEAAQKARLPGQPGPEAGDRALTVPLSDPARVPTFAANGTSSFGQPGGLLVVGHTSSGFPAGTRDAAVVRAMAFVSPGADGRYAPLTLHAVPFAGLNGTETRDVDVDVPTLAGGQKGFLVKGDAEADLRFVALGDVTGEVARFAPTLSVWHLAGTGGVGFVAPLLVLIATHRRRGVRGPGASGACPECGTAVAGATDFCPRCGAWLSGKGGAGGA